MVKLATAALGLVLTAAAPWMIPGMRYVPPEPAVVTMLAFAALGVTAGNFCVNMACRRADLSVAPFRYSVMPFALMSGYFVWNNIPDLWAALGIVLICSSGLYAFYRERLRAKAALRG